MRRTSIKARRPLVGWALAFALLAGGCGGNDEEGGGDQTIPQPEPPATSAPEPPPTETPASSIPVATDPAVCGNGYPVPMEWRATTQQVADALQHLDGCINVNDSGVWLHNRTTTVWLLTQPPELRWQSAAPSLDVEIFRAAADPRAGLTIEPGVSLEIDSPSSGVRVELSDSVTRSWATVKLLQDTADAKAVDGFTKAVAAGRATRESYIECARAGWDAGKFATSDPFADEADKLETVSDGLGLAAQGSSCGAALATAAAQERARQAQDVPLVTDVDLLRTAKSPLATQADEASRALGLATDAATGLKLFRLLGPG